MNVLCTICARGGSKGVKNKNIRQLCGKPLLAHSILQAKATHVFDKIVVSSDAAAILKAASIWGADHTVIRPAELATDTAAKLPAIYHAVRSTEDFYGKKFDFIVDLDVTSPLRNSEDILLAFKMMTESQAPNLISATPARRSPYFNMVEKNADGTIGLVKELNQPVIRRQDAPICYDMNASIYIWRREALFSQEKLIVPSTLVYIMPEERSVDIDSLLDWKIVQYLSKQKQEII